MLNGIKKLRHICLGTRGSELALRQTNIVCVAIQTAEPNCKVEVKIIKTKGDTDQSPIPLDTIGKGWFTKEIEKELLNGSIDAAVHSLKDMPELLPPNLHISSYPEREDPRDVLISRENKMLKELHSGAIVGTDSIRRKVQILALRTDLVVESLRGNVLKRLEKLDAGDYDAVVLAAAGIKRLNIEDRISQYFTTAEIMPAPGQGILAIETRKDNDELNVLMQKISNKEAVCAAMAERTFAHTIGGGCKTPVGACAHIENDKLILEGMFSNNDEDIKYASISGSLDNAKKLGEQLAKKLLQ